MLCADSYEGDGLTKSQADKVVQYDSDWCKVGFVGAGQEANVIDSTVQRIIEEFDYYKPKTEAEIKSAVREALNDLPDTRNAANLLLAVCPSVDPHAMLWEVSDRYLRTVTNGHAVRGIGSVIGFVADRFYRPEMTLYQGVLLSAHLLQLGNAHVDGVNGPSRVLVLTDGGWLLRERTDKVEKHESVFDQLDAALSYIYLPFADTSITQEEFDQRLTTLIDTIRKLRTNHFDEFRDAHLSMAINDPTYQGDAYQTLPNNTRTQIGFYSVGYEFEHTPEGISGYGKLLPKKPARASRGQDKSPSSPNVVKYKQTDASTWDVSFSASASVSPSSSASPSHSDDEEDNANENED